MTHQRPAGEAMSREGKGTAAAGEAGNSRPVRWEDFEERLTQGGWFWLATVRPNRRRTSCHCSPFGRNRRCTLLRRGRPRRVETSPPKDAASSPPTLGTCTRSWKARPGGCATRRRLRRASNAFETIYGWPTVVKAGMLDAEYGAPTSGGPPYDVYEITPTKAFGLPTDGESFTPTRWSFDR